jgi:hypothetical protein
MRFETHNSMYQKFPSRYLEVSLSFSISQRGLDYLSRLEHLRAFYWYLPTNDATHFKVQDIKEMVLRSLPKLERVGFKTLQTAHLL